MRFTYGALFVAIVACGCDAPPTPTSPLKAKSPSHAQHSTLSTQHSTLSGRIVWIGTAPQAAPINALRNSPDGTTTLLTRPAPNLPTIGPDNGVQGAVVFLRGIDPATARDFDWPPVTVEMHDERPMIHQGNGPPGNTGFVRRGDDISIVSKQTIFHSLRARGAAFWTVTLPNPDRPRTRRLEQPGVVELSSGAYYFWMRSYLWVCDHPYYVATDASGHWTLTGVPPGDYDLVAWLPDWRIERQERDPETGKIARYEFRPPFEVTRRVTVRNDESTAIGDIPINP